ncbi:SCO family protein [Tateyamaria omphalii]|uniref:Photosynthetic protein synthase I n=1 Tax=Tateyamaria omphalii TaxID=299262 RepID=A0A1P8MRV0_9RHOB|nr:SCO family protein [Tateyamaria omphalii]APX10781.1 photosynthetic protein synthase I [Tateyamaria omphalii]
MWRALVTAFMVAVGIPAAGQSPFPVDIGGPYELVDQFGEVRTEADPDGKYQLVFFGYANCLNICSAAMPLMAQVVDELAGDGIGVTPVMITVAPDQDRVETMGAPLADIHPNFIGLTGDEGALQAAYEAFKVEVEPLFEDPEHGWIYSHGSFVHLLDADGALLTLLPPVLDVEQVAKIARGYIPEAG